MSNERTSPGREKATRNGTDWSFTVRGSQLPQPLDAPDDPRRRYELAGRIVHELDGSVTFYGSRTQVAAWQEQAIRTGRSFDQIARYHFVMGVDVQGPDDLVLTMRCHPRGDE